MSQIEQPLSSSFEMLHPELQRWIWEKGWDGLHDAQERAIPLLLAADSDVLIGANTAAGKTEAAFLPILSRLVGLPIDQQLVLQISPLKALINDQYQRLGLICERLDLPVIPWHGDIAASRKKSFLKAPSRGVVLITPESLEALFVNKGSQVPALFSGLQYIIVDEMHSFIGTERGRQLASLMHRIETAVGRFIPRVGLSATLGDMKLAAAFLRANRPVHLIESKSGSNTLLLQLKAYYMPAVKPQNSAKEIKITEDLEPLTDCDDDQCSDESDSVVINDIAQHIYRCTRDSKNLIFPNSRQSVEYYADAFRALCDADKRPNCYWPHHGNLSKEFREEVEANLKAPDVSANGVCTSTLEMGVDIGDVKSVAQIGRPTSVAGLRQRLGRSGRKRGVPSILRAYSYCKELTAKSEPPAMMHPDLIQSIACIELLIQGWYEPPARGYLHLSTLVHQVLSSIAQYTARTARELWDELIASGPHKGLTKAEFRDLLISLGGKKLIMQDADGAFLLGEVGESLVNHYEFYSVFPLTEEYRVECRGRLIGTIVKDQLLTQGQKIVFAGRRWVIEAINTQTGIIEVEHSRGGSAISFGGLAASTHDRVIAEMKSLLSGDGDYSYLDETARAALREARAFFNRAELYRQNIVRHDGDVYIFTWRGNVVNNTLGFLFQEMDIDVKSFGFYLVIPSITLEKLRDILIEIDSMEDVSKLFAGVVAPEFNRWDWALTPELRTKDFMARACDFHGTKLLIKELVQI